MDHHIYYQLSIVIGIGCFVALIMRILRQPLIIGHIATGIVIGPNLLGVLGNNESLEVFSSLGITLLLFIIGLGLNPSIIKEVGKVAGAAGSIQVALTTASGFAIGKFGGLNNSGAIFLGLCLSFSSTIIILKILSDKKEQARLYGKITTGILLIQDLAATVALLFIAAYGNGGLSGSSLLSLSIKGAGLVAGLILLGHVILKRTIKFIAASQELLFLFAIAWGFGISAIFAKSGFSLEIGALLAGISLSHLPYSQEIASRLRPLRDFFVVVFFISLGSGLNLDGLGQSALIAISLALITLIVKPILTLIAIDQLGYTRRTSFKVAVNMSNLSEFSLVLAIIAHSQNLLPDVWISGLTISALGSIAFSTYGITYSDWFYDKLTKYKILKIRSIYKDREHASNLNAVLFGYNHGGHEFLKTLPKVSKKFAVVDYNPDIIETLDRRNIATIYGDASDKELLDELGLDTVKLIISTITDFETTKFLLAHSLGANSKILFIGHADNSTKAQELYDLGASYVIVPHDLGSEKISRFLRQHGINKTEFSNFRARHLAIIQNQID